MPVQTDPALITDTAIEQLQALLEANGFPGWAPSDGNLEIILLSVIATMAADAATVASQVPAAVFRAFGTQLFNLPYQQGAAATCSSTWTLADTAGHTIAAGTYVTVADQGFYAQADVTVAPGSSVATVPLVAVASGTDYNGLSAPVVPVDEIDWVTSITVGAPSSGGVDAETDSAYQDRLAGELALQAPRPITASDYAAFVMSVPTSITPSGVVVGRSTAIDGYSPANSSFVITTTNGSATATVTTPPDEGVTAAAGATITGTGIPAATKVLSSTTTTIVMSANATASNTGVTATVAGSYGNERTVTVFVTDPAGVALSGPAMTAIQGWLQGFREVNFQVAVVAPTYFPVYVTAQVHVLPGFDSAGVVAAAKQALVSYLNPATWGGPWKPGGPPWLNSAQGFNIVRYNKLLGQIEQTPGVDYVPSGSAGLAIGFSASPSATADLTMTGPAPLPISDLSTPTVIVTAV